MSRTSRPAPAKPANNAVRRPVGTSTAPKTTHKAKPQMAKKR